MSHLKSTIQNFANRMKNIAKYGFAPLYGFGLNLKTILTGEYNALQKVAKIFVLTLSFPILLALTALTLPLGILASICQIAIFPFQCLIAALRDYGTTSTSPKEPVNPQAGIPTQDSFKRLGNLKTSPNTLTDTLQPEFHTPLLHQASSPQSNHPQTSQSRP